MAEWHKHPMNPRNSIYGTKLKPGDKTEANDFYASTTGIWEKAPCVGLVLQEGATTYWVRKEKE